MPSIILKSGKEHRLLAGHSWVYAGEIAKITGDPRDGDAVDIRDQKNRFFGRGLLNTRSQITVRRFTTQKMDLDDAFFRRRLEAALQYRLEAGGQRSEVSDQSSAGQAGGTASPPPVSEGSQPESGAAFRVVSSEADLVPGLILDKYGDHLVLQALTLGIDQRKTAIIQIARELLQPRAIIERSDVPTRKLEGLEETKGVVWGDSDGQVIIAVGGVTFAVNLLEDQKTGFFLDQRENYRAVARHCAGRRVLDCFAYHGGFALAAARAGATTVAAVEISEPAVARARHNAELNQLTGRIEFLCANTFDVLKTYDRDQRPFDLIVLDPPSFTRTKQNVGDALRGYKEINLRALKILSPGGLLATFSCSHHINAELFKAVILEAAADARKTLRLVKVLTQSPDHPILPAIPETEYLKGLLLQVL